MSLNFRVLIITYIIFVLISPWVYPLVHNRNTLNLTPIKVNYADREILLSEVNSLRGEAVGVSSPLATKLLTNKIVLSIRYYLNTYFQSFDPGFLFFSGTDDVLSTKSNGSFHITFLVFILVGTYRLLTAKRLKWLATILLLITPLPAAYFGWPYKPFLLIPFFLTLTFFAATGFTYLLFKHKKAFTLLSILLCFEVIRFLHIFINHYLH